MIDRLVVGIAQWLPAPGSPGHNLETALGFVHELADRRCDLVVLPELWPVGLRPETFADDLAAGAESLDGARARRLGETARKRGIWLAAGSLPESTAGGIYNTAPLFARDGRLIAAHRKCHLYTAFGEDRAFVRGESLTVADTGEFGRVGVSICFDGDFPEVAREMRRRGAGLIVHPSAYETSAAAWWDTLYPANALANGQWWIMANQCSAAGSVTYLGASKVVSPDGSVVAEAGRSTQGATPAPELLVVEIDFATSLERAARENAALWEAVRPELYGT